MPFIISYSCHLLFFKNNFEIRAIPADFCRSILRDKVSWPRNRESDTGRAGKEDFHLGFEGEREVACWRSNFERTIKIEVYESVGDRVGTRRSFTKYEHFRHKYAWWRVKIRIGRIWNAQTLTVELVFKENGLYFLDFAVHPIFSPLRSTNCEDTNI